MYALFVCLFIVFRSIIPGVAERGRRHRHIVALRPMLWPRLGIHPRRLPDWHFVFFFGCVDTFHTRPPTKPNYLVRMAFLTISRCLFCVRRPIWSLYTYILLRRRMRLLVVCLFHCLPRANVCVWVQSSPGVVFGPQTVGKKSRFLINNQPAFPTWLRSALAESGGTHDAAALR